MTLSLLPHRPQVLKALPNFHHAQIDSVNRIDPVALTSAVKRLSGELGSNPSLEELAAVWQLAEGYRRERDEALTRAESFKRSCDARAVCIQDLIRAGFRKGQGQ